MVFLYPQDAVFPPVETATPDGLLAIGGDLSLERLLNAYQHGIFPWYNEDDPIMWWAPPQRMVLFFDELKISKSMRKVIRTGGFTVTFNRAFEQVIRHCKEVPRKDGLGTWIQDEIVAAYTQLHHRGVAHSVEVWQDDQLVGGLYGVDMFPVFCGESMFHLVPNASKVAFIALAARMQQKGYALIDCQLHNPHLESLGCREIPRAEFMRYLPNSGQ